MSCAQFWTLCQHLSSGYLVAYVMGILLAVQLVEQVPDRPTPDGVSNQQALDEAFNSNCDYPCKCPSASVQCRSGIDNVKDGCDCCYVCPRQQGELCDFKARCDDSRGLYCDMESDPSVPGICRVRAGKPCHVNGATHKDGDTFQPNCKQTCTCQNGVHACVSNCPQEDIKPSSIHCDNLRLIRIENQCCKDWVCVIHQNQPGLTNPDWSATDEPSTVNPCVVESTPWSQCSVTCGMGESVRVSNDNDQCETTKERRLCILRPCGTEPVVIQGSSNKKCKQLIPTSEKIRIQYAGCESIKLYKLKYCGVCRNKCCMPTADRTIPLQMTCHGGVAKTYHFMRITDCGCAAQCL